MIDYEWREGKRPLFQIPDGRVGVLIETSQETVSLEWLGKYKHLPFCTYIVELLNGERVTVNQIEFAGYEVD